MIKIASLATVAVLAATSASAQISINTSDVRTPAGAARFERDIALAARQLCSGSIGVRKVQCKQAVRQEALEQLPDVQRLAFLRSRETTNTRYAADRTDVG